MLWTWLLRIVCWSSLKTGYYLFAVNEKSYPDNDSSSNPPIVFTLCILVCWSSLKEFKKGIWICLLLNSFSYFSIIWPSWILLPIWLVTTYSICRAITFLTVLEFLITTHDIVIVFVYCFLSYNIWSLVVFEWKTQAFNLKDILAFILIFCNLWSDMEWSCGRSVTSLMKAKWFVWK